MSSAHASPMRLNQSPTTRPLFPYALYPVFSGISTLRLPWFGFPPTMFLLIRAGSRTPLNGVSAIDFPAYLFSSGLTSNDSRCETPPHRNIPITDVGPVANSAPLARSPKPRTHPPPPSPPSATH